MEKSSIYTKTGDKGKTSLVGGQRVDKDSLSLECYGTSDELNSMLGLLRNKTELESDLLFSIQNNLFTLGSVLASEPEDRDKFKLARITNEHISELEKKMDQLDSSLPTLKNFILPGGDEASSTSHLCRVICRRLERLMVSLGRDDNNIENELIYINRLSDFFFIFARSINMNKGIEDVIWKS